MKHFFKEFKYTVVENKLLCSLKLWVSFTSWHSCGNRKAAKLFELINIPILNAFSITKGRF